MKTAGAAAHRWGWSLNRTDSTASNAHPSAKPSSAGEDILFCRNERDGDENRGSNQPSGYRCSDDQPDPTLGHRLDASGFLEIAVVDCRIHDGLISIRD